MSLTAAEVEKIRRETVRAVLDLFESESSKFYYNVPNDYGAIDLTLWTGKGDPTELFMGAETQGKFADGVRGTGRYKLNEAAVDMVMESIASK